jgi:uncharacterized protein (TIGR03000 family)
MTTIRALFVIGALVTTAVGAFPAQPLADEPRLSQATAQAAGLVTTRLTVTMPQEDATLSLDGETSPGQGIARVIETKPLKQGATERHTISATWQPNSYTTMTRTKTVSIRGGDPVTVDLTVDDPEDRVRVIYVPTPQDIAEEMVRLARVTSRDLVYEPGCGDARITIAAIKAGAPRAICIDIDPARAEESRSNVEKAGLKDRIDVRLGDALELKDLTKVTVVLLYMGDHFNMLIRPVLWRDLPVGSRIVSHRFTMGDWKPDRTITVNGAEGGIYDLHLWTITEDVKRKLKTR